MGGVPPVRDAREESASVITLPGSLHAPAASRAFIRTALSTPRATAVLGPVTARDRLVDDAVLLVSELVTNAVLHAGTPVEVSCRPVADDPGVIIEVADRHPASAVYSGPDTPRRGRGLQLLGALAESWGVTYQRTRKIVWLRLNAIPYRSESDASPSSTLGGEPRFAEVIGPAPPAEGRYRTAEWVDRSGSSFLAESSELFAGQLDEHMVAALAGQLLVPRLADWCAVWLRSESGRPRLSHVWHNDERRIAALRTALTSQSPPTGLDRSAVPWPWPDFADDHTAAGSALAFPLVAHGRDHGVLLLGRTDVAQPTEGVVRLLEDLARRVAQAVATARQYTRQATISLALQRRQLPPSLARIPGVDSAIVYEPHGEGLTVGGDFYDLFPMGQTRWCFLLGDVCGSDPEAMSITGLARHLVRLLAREGHGVESVLTRLNEALVEEDIEARAGGGEQPLPRFLSLLYGELEPESAAGGARCRVASAGHPPPLRLTADGSVVPAASPQILLGIDQDYEFHADTFVLAPGETLLCVTDGVTERRRGKRQLDDGDGLADILRGCGGLGAQAVAERVRRATHDFSPEPIKDDIAILVLEALPITGTDILGATPRV
ncbi:SpoIIE family protein phosphatase [Streptomyces jeddahensis]|uniref:Stage II sporulation protein E (SpoIIE) n=1 Tax=Streptomyces jeddahensis TaxID=1716141 RepID=A0A177HVE0_9ACTN|nr:SpoIIE family protein phosphatase [Streptomyces jeddahensis]OAH14599.1 stage II sporulation protein E (SpoIIE) [Streptomyces jeddahensis]